MGLVAWLEELDRGALGRAGGKGANLGELVRAGLPVPPGFVVTAAAYRAHLAGAGLEGRIASRLRGLAAGDPGGLAAACTDIAGWIAGAPVPAPVAAAVREAYGALGARLPGAPPDPPVAVRSSATAEDLPEASFAGQQETCLNMAGPDQVLGAVRRCWASLWSPRAAAYRSRMGYEHQAVSLAVVVQAMVPAEVAGVMFTANPITGATDEFVVTASYGLGEAVVNGLVTPDTFLLAPGGTVRERTLGHKEQRIVPAGAAAGDGPETGAVGGPGPAPDAATRAGTRTEPVPAADRDRFCLNDQELAALAELGRRVTAHYGAPQDTEWALAGGRLYLLQARPITTLAAPGPAAPPPLGRREQAALGRMAMNFVDHFPEPLQPLDLTTVARLAMDGIFAVFTDLGVQMPPARSLMVELPDGRVAFRPRLPRPSVRLLWRVPHRLFRALGADPGAAWARLRAEWTARLEPLAQVDPGALDAPGLAARIQEILGLFAQFIPCRFREVFAPGLLHEALARFWARRAVGRGRAPEVVRRLFLALPHRTALMNRDMARLARTAAEHGQDTPAFAGALASFLAQWGDRPAAGMVPVPGLPTWREDPTAVLGLVDALGRNAGALDPDALERRQEADFAAARDQVCRRLGRVTRRWFLHHLERARGFLVAREDSLFLFEQVSALVRRLALALGARLAAAGVLAAPDQVFFLVAEELAPAAAGQLDVGERVARRRRGHARICAAHARGHNWLLAAGGVAGPAAAPAAAAGQRLTGLPASPGRATGPACVVRGPAEFGKLRPGDVLVAPATAPAWTPLFGVAAAVVTDIGGALSHAAIVAREYGIPAVLATGRATATYRDRQRLTVDGSAGWVAGAE